MRAEGTRPSGHGAPRNARELHRAQRARHAPAVPRHRLLRLIGSGAYGEVWLARADTGAFRAVKVVWREDFTRRELYEQELAGARLYEPLSRRDAGLVPVWSIGCVDDEYCYFVMELADDAVAQAAGFDPQAYVPRTLQWDMQRNAHRPLPLGVVLETGAHLARALAALHRAGLTHRDIKPSNIVFIRGLPRLADAGMVSGATAGGGGHAGTQGYVPPEGLGSEQADVYALALVLYEMATGLDRLDFPSLPPQLPEGDARWLAFNALVCRAAEPEPRRRRSLKAAAMAEQLEALLLPQEPRPWWRRIFGA